MFIFIGSAVPADTSKIHHSGTGRFAWLTMRSMSLSESKDSSNEISLKELFENPSADIFATNQLNIDSLAWLICRGGWPKATMVSKDIALDMAYRYYEAVVNSDISRIDGVTRDAERAKRILRPTPVRRLHNRCWTCAHQLLCERTTADVRLAKLYFPKTFDVFSAIFNKDTHKKQRHSLVLYREKCTFVPQ